MAGTLLFDHSLTLTGVATGFTIAGGTTSKTLTVVDDCTVNQDLQTTDSPTFAGITIPDGGTIGQVAGPLLTFDDTNNYLEIMGCDIGLGTTTPGTGLSSNYSPVFQVESASGYPALAVRCTDSTRGAFFEQANDRDGNESALAFGTYGSTNSDPALFGVARADMSLILKYGMYPLVIGTLAAGNLTFGTYNTARMTILSGGNIGVATPNPLGKFHIDQSVSDAAIPVLILDQADVSEEMIEFVSTIGVGNAIEAVGGKNLTTTHFIKVTLPGALTRYIPVGTIA